MAVDKNLFLYDLAMVAIMKNEAPYAKEWLDYHLLAGVDHFYIYDNEESDVQLKVLQPYIERGIVTRIPYPGKGRQYEAYTDAAQNYRFFCRYMAFIDGDEFILPKSKSTISEVVDEILGNYPEASGLGINWIMFGSNYQEHADYNRGVLERFTRCQTGANFHVKVVTNPRKVHFFENSHNARYFVNQFPVNEQGKFFANYFSDPPSVEKIVIHHYFMKSREEFIKKVRRGTGDNFPERKIEDSPFEQNNDIFNDSILKYRTARRLETGGGGCPGKFGAAETNRLPAPFQRAYSNSFPDNAEKSAA